MQPSTRVVVQELGMGLAVRPEVLGIHHPPAFALEGQRGTPVRGAFGDGPPIPQPGQVTR